MGLVSQIDVSEYWTINPVIAIPFFLSVMSRDRFLLILTFLYLNDNKNYLPRGSEGFNPLFKRGLLYERMLSRFRTVYKPYQALDIDESMVAWRRNLTFRIKSAEKPIKHGLKAYKLCDAENALCLKFNLYTGRSIIQPSKIVQHTIL